MIRFWTKWLMAMMMAGCFSLTQLSPVLADSPDQEFRLKALEEKLEALQKDLEAVKKSGGKSASRGKEKSNKKTGYNVRGIEKYGEVEDGYSVKGFHFQTEDGLFSTNLAWRAQMRYSHRSEAGEDPITESDFRKKQDNENFEARRLRMKIGGHGYKPWLQYYFEIDLQPSREVTDSAINSSSRLIDWRIDVQPYEQIGFRLGQWKINYNNERVVSSGQQQFVERSIVNNDFTLDRQVGFMLQGRLFKGTLAETRYYAGVFNGEGRSVNNQDNNMMYMGRLQWNFLGRDMDWSQTDVDYHREATGILAFAAMSTESACTRWSSSGCGALKGYSIGSAGQYKISQYLEEFIFKYRGFSIQNEFHWKYVEDNHTRIEHDLKGAYAQGGYFFHEIVPEIPEGLEAIFRYAFVDEPDDSNLFLTNNRKEYTAGFNYFIAGHNNKVTVDYSHLTLEDASSKRDYANDRVRVQWEITF